MVIVAKSVKGREYMYSAKSAHKVPKKSAQRIADALNESKTALPCDGSFIWFVHQIDEFDAAHDYAELQSFYIKSGYLCRKHARGFDL